MRPRPHTGVIAALLLLLPLAAVAGGQPAAPANPEAWQPELLERWLSSVERHQPGELDGPLLEATRWTRDDLRRLWVDIQVLLRVVDVPQEFRFRVRPIESLSARSPVTVAPLGMARAGLDALAARVGGPNLPAILKRATIVHTDIATLAADMVSTDGDAVPMTASVMMLVGDGRPGGAESISLHWDLGRLLVEQLHRRAPGDLWARDWYRATLGRGQWLEAFDSNHMRHALRIIPGDAWLRFLEGCQHEGLAAPLFQEFARPFRGTAMRPDMRSEDDELDAAATAFREALRIDPTMAEARLRLGRVRGRQGNHAAAVEELRRAAAEVTEPLLRSYAQIFLALEYEALGDTTAATASYTQAAASAPDAPLPRLALARLAHVRGNRDAQVANLDQALAPRSEPQDPWWFYRGSQARHAETWLTEVRNAATRPAP